jgi:hypothetical protein
VRPTGALEKRKVYGRVSHGSTREDLVRLRREVEVRRMSRYVTLVVTRVDGSIGWLRVPRSQAQSHGRRQHRRVEASPQILTRNHGMMQFGG